MKICFKNKKINIINIHTILHRFSSNIYDVFSSLYLISLGLSFPIVALVTVCRCVLSFILRPISLISIKKIGLLKSLIIGTIIYSLLFMILSKVNGINSWLYFYILYLAICDITYWLPYHSYYAIVGDNEKRGKQIGFQRLFTTIIKILSPIIGGIIIVNFGFLYLYITATIIMLLSVIPLLFSKNIVLNVNITLKNALSIIDKKGFIIQIGSGILYVHTFIWTIVLFYLVKDYIIFGGLVTFELISTSLLFILLGYLIDKGKGLKITKIGLILIGLVIIFRSFFIVNIFTVIITDIIIAFGMVFYQSSFDVSFYNLAKQSKNPLWFNFFGEIGWDIGASFTLLLSASLFMFGIPLKYLMVLSIAGLFITYSVLKKYYLNETN